MANFTGKFKVWKKEEVNGITKVDLGDSSKNKDGTWNNFSWFGCALFKEAKEVTLSEGDTVSVTNGLITKYKSPKDGKYYDNVVIFDIEVTKQGEVKSKDPVAEFIELDESEQLPF